MPKVDPIITSFAGGEFGAALKGRTDIDQYYAAAEIVSNFLVKPSGSLISAPGTQYVAEVKNSSKTTRLLEFIFNRSDAYVIEFGDQYFRFYTQQGQVISNSTIYEVSHCYTEDELWDVQFAQLNDVIYMAHPDHKPRKLTRKASNNWDFTELDFTGGPFLDDNTDDSITLSVTDSSGTIDVTASEALFTVSSGSTNGHENTYWKLGGTTTNSTTGLEEQGYIQLTSVVDTTTATASVIKTLTVTGSTSYWAEGAWSAVRGWPARVAFHQRRLFFARTDYEPQTLWGSQSYIYDDFRPGDLDDDGLALTLASNEANEIQWLNSTNDLVVGTYGGEFRIYSSTEGGPLTPSDATARKQTSWGSEDAKPVKAGNFIYYLQRFGKKLRELYYTWDLDTYKSVNKTILNPEILGEGAIDLGFQQNPYPIIYCVKTNGTLACLTREIDQELQAWANIKTEDGDAKFRSIAVVPSYSEDYDEVWVVVERTIEGATKRYIEFFRNIDKPARQDDCKYLHSGLSYSAYENTSSSTVNISLTGTDGSIAITASTGYFLATDENMRIRAIDSNGDTLGEAKITSYGSTTVVSASVIKAFDSTSYNNYYWGISVDSVSGLGHLEGKEVAILGDGGLDKPNPTVATGSISLSYNYFKVHAGLPYNQILLTLPIEAGSERGTSQGKIQRIHRLALKVNDSYKGFEVGGSSGTIDMVRFRDPTTLMGSPEDLYTGIIENIPFRGGYEYGAQIYLKNNDPLPLEILSIMPQLKTNEI